MAGKEPNHVPSEEEIWAEAARLRALRKPKSGKPAGQKERYGKAAEEITIIGRRGKPMLEPDNLVDVQGER